MDSYYGGDDDFKSFVGETLGDPIVQLVIVVVCLVLLTFLALKAGFSLWVMAKLGLGEEETPAAEHLRSKKLWGTLL